MEKWTIDNQDNYPDEYAICDDMGSLICTIPREDQYREQDAHLIAAAPELLEACKAMSAALLKNRSVNLSPDMIKASDMIYKAIQKAQP